MIRYTIKSKKGWLIDADDFKYTKEIEKAYLFDSTGEAEECIENGKKGGSIKEYIHKLDVQIKDLGIEPV